MMKKITRTGVINDLHIPWHDPKAVDLVLDTFEDIGIDRLIINGDLLDMCNISSHSPKDPQIKTLLEDEFCAGLEFIKELRRRFPDADIVFLYGNHEDRLNRYILNNARAFYGSISIEKKLMLYHFNIEYHDYQVKYRLEDTDLTFVHSPPSYAKNGAMTSLEGKLDGNYMYACTHRVQHAQRTGDSGKVYNCWFNGWLGSTNLTDEHYHAYKWTRGHENWQLCASLVTVVDGKEFAVEQFTSLPNYLISTNGFVYRP